MSKLSIQSQETQIVLLSKEEIDRAAGVMSDSFATDPLASYLLPDAQARLEVMHWFWREALRHSHSHSHNYTTAPEIWGVSSWLPPGAPRESLWSLSHLIIRTLYCAGWQSTYRLFALFQFAEMLRDRHCPKPHWYLDGLAVSPESQGMGIGGLLLRTVLEVADCEGQECCLYTSTERAVRFYQRQGFIVCEEARFETAAPPLWLMVRSPKDFK